MAKIKLTDAELTARAKKYNLIKHNNICREVVDMVDKNQGVYEEVRKRAKELEKEGDA